jgi:hypothetical protein
MSRVALLLLLAHPAFAGEPPASLTAKEFEGLWDDLAGDDAAKAYRAIWRIADGPGGVGLLGKKLRPVPHLDEAGRKRVEELLRELDDKSFMVRQRAMREFDKYGETALPWLKKALAAGPSLETKRRIEELLGKYSSRVPDRETLRGLRAVEALEYAGNAEALKLLESVGAGAPEARLTLDARTAAGRLKKRVAKGDK